jgi:hypothetical protein
MENELAGVFINSIDLDDFNGEFCAKGPFPYLSNSLGLLLHLDRLEKNLTLTTPKTIQRKISPKVTKLRLVNNYKIVLKPKEQLTSTVSSRSNYMEPIDFQEKLWKQQQQVAMQDTVGRFLEQPLNEQIDDSNSPFQQSSTESVPLQFFYTQIVKNNNNQTWFKQIEKANNHDQKLNIQLLEHLKAKQAETLKEWLTLQEKHNKQEQILKELKDQIEKQTIQSIDSIIAMTTTTTTIRTSSSNRFRTISKSLWKPKPIFNIRTATINLISKQNENQNKCLNKKFGIHRDEMNCSTFYICEQLSNGGELMHKFTCPFGFEFDVFTCICVSLKFKL